MTRLAALVAAALAGCTAGANDPRPVPDSEPVQPLTDVEQGVAELAVATLAAHLGIPRDRIQVDTVRAVQWPDSSLGCPSPGKAYLTVVTPGHKVTLRVDREVHVVHEAGNRAIVCSQSKAMGGLTPRHDLSFGPQMLAARKDLAVRLGVPEAQILFQSGEGRTFNDASLGCPEPGLQYAQAEVRGWMLTFRHGPRTYTYHSDLDRTIPCPPIAAE